jgi:hypothetical protein
MFYVSVYQLSFECLLSAMYFRIQRPHSLCSVMSTSTRGLLPMIESPWHCLSSFSFKANQPTKQKNGNFTKIEK